MSEDDKKGKTLKYVWQDGDYKLVSEKEFNELVEKGEITLYNFKKEFPCCHETICCSCDEEDVKIAKRISLKIFQFIKKEYFNSLFKNEPFKPTIIKIFNNLISLSKNVLPEEIVLTKQIYCAVYMSLLDSLGKDKDIKLTEEDVETLMKSFNSTLQNINREKLIKDFKLKLKKKAIVFNWRNKTNKSTWRKLDW